MPDPQIDPSFESDPKREANGNVKLVRIDGTVPVFHLRGFRVQALRRAQEDPTGIGSWLMEPDPLP